MGKGIAAAGSKDESKIAKSLSETLDVHSILTEEEHAERNKIFHRAYILFGLIISFFIVGMIGFMVLEPDQIGHDPLKAFHLVIQTITTTGYGDIPPLTPGGRLLADCLMIFGVTIAAFGGASLVEFVVSGRLRETMRVTNYARKIADMKDHVIVCGYGRVGSEATQELVKNNIQVVVLDHNKEALEELDIEIPRILGDASKDEDLVKAGIKDAVAIIATTGNDADNLMTLVTAKYIKPGIIAITRSNVEEDNDKFLKVGADMVVSPEQEGGRSMAKMLQGTEDKVLIAGYGRVGSAAATQLHDMGVPVIVMDRDPIVLETVPEDITKVAGDATKESDLRMAGVDKVKITAILTTYGLDANNLLATVTAKYFRPSITVIARAGSPRNVKKMLKVGADVVISPEAEGGKSMAKWAAQAVTMAKQKE
jgi:Trk K+ transport system NAD-binding subunit